MFTKKNKEVRLKIRHERIRKKVIGTSECPRLSVHKSLKNLYAQIIDDSSARTLVSISTLDKDFRQRIKYGGNIKVAAELGLVLGEKAKVKGITKVCFDRSGYRYHGRVQALAESARKAGLSF